MTAFETTPRKQFTAQQKAKLFLERAGKCHCCGRTLRPGDGWIVEHVQALENGGSNDPSNLDITCEWCKPKKDAEDHAKAAKTRHVATKHVVPSSERKSRRGFRKPSGMKFDWQQGRYVRE